MTTYPGIISRLPETPDEYSADHIARLTQQLDILARMVNNPGHVQATTLALTALPDGGYNLRVGDVYSADGILRIVRAGDAPVTGSSMTVSIGSVTVTVA